MLPEPAAIRATPCPVLAAKAFGQFQAGVLDRCEQPPVQREFTEVGSCASSPATPYSGSG